MNTEVWASIGTIVATLVLLIVPALVYTWYVLEHMIGDKQSYERVIAFEGDEQDRASAYASSARPDRRATDTATPALRTRQ
jgi:hypothetical protein